MTEPAPWLELDSEFEGVGAHRLNPRYDPVDEPSPQSKARLAALVVPKLTLVAPVGPAARLVAPYRLDGHDGSHHQFDAGPVDLHVLADATWILWWKATQSTSYTDPTFGHVWGNRTLFRNRLAYHWLSSTTDPVQQANHYLQVVGKLGPGDGVMLDAEEGGITAAGCLAWCEAVEAVTHRPASVYTGLYVSGGTIWKSDALRQSKYGPRAFHVAAYVTEESLRARMISTGSQNYPWQAWQFSSNGPVPGITGRADMNRVDDKAAYDLATSLTAPAPIPPNPNPPLGDDEMAVITNSEPHTFTDGNTYPPGVVKWIAGVEKRHLQSEEWQALYGAVAGVALSNEALASIPDYKAPAASGAQGPMNLVLTLNGSASGTATPK